MYPTYLRYIIKSYLINVQPPHLSVKYNYLQKCILSQIEHFVYLCFFFFQAEDGIRDTSVTGVQTCALPISHAHCRAGGPRGAARCRWLGGLALAASFGVRWTRGAGQAIGRRAAVREPEPGSGRSEERRVGKECRSRWVAWQW